MAYRHLSLLIFATLSTFSVGINLDLPAEFIPYYFNTFPSIEEECRTDPQCPYKMHMDKNVCWGYEDRCSEGKVHKYSHPICDGDHKGWVNTKQEQVATFFEQGDFGYVRKFRNSMTVMCEPKELEDSSLECSEFLTFCRGRNIMIDLRRLINRTEPIMYDMDVLTTGDIGGHCKLHKEFLDSQAQYKSPLQTWAPEMQHFVELPKRPLEKDSKMCDHVIKTPTFIMKIDATVNMYHHFCDFFNLFASLFVNQTDNNPDVFTKKTRIMIWRTFKYSSNFEATFRAFTDYPLLDLNDFAGKRVCFKNAVFPLLPRMIFGLFYNTPLIWGCRNSGLFHSFSKFLLHRLRVKPKTEFNPKNIKITWLSRQTKYRRVLNEDELLDELRKNRNLNVQKVAFTWKTDFIDQLHAIQDSDILIGMHGAGLTHLLFMPDWGAIIELYNCGDEHCYSDLARLRGLKYITWRNKTLLQEVEEPNSEYGPAHEKHRNYIFKKDAFFNLIQEAIEHLKDYAKKEFGHDEL